MYKDILRNSYVLTKTLKCLCTLYLKNSNLQIFIHEKLCMKLQLNDEKTHVDPWSHIDTFEGWTVLTETIVLCYMRATHSVYVHITLLLKAPSTKTKTFPGSNFSVFGFMYKNITEVFYQIKMVDFIKKF